MESRCFEADVKITESRHGKSVRLVSKLLGLFAVLNCIFLRNSLLLISLPLSLPPSLPPSFSLLGVSLQDLTTLFLSTITCAGEGSEVVSSLSIEQAGVG